MAIIAKNNTAAKVKIADLGISIPASDQRDLTEVYRKAIITASEDLLVLVANGTFTINDGTEDLSITDGIKQVTMQTEWEDEDIIPPHSLESHIDVDITSPTQKQKMIYDSTASLWINVNSDITNTVDPPSEPQPGDIWQGEGGNLPWMYSGAGDWISIYRSFMTYTKRRNSDGEYLPIGGNESADFYWFPRPGIITSIYCFSEKGNDIKTFYIRDWDQTIFTFQYPGGNIREYSNSNLYIPVSKGARIRFYVDKGDGGVEDTTGQIETAWKFEE